MPDRDIVPNHIDVDAVIRRARRRRAPRRAGVIVTGVVAAAAIIGGLTLPNLLPQGSSASTSASAGHDASVVPQPAGAEPAACGSLPPQPTPQANGLLATATQNQIELHNTGPARIAGVIGSEVVLVARNDRVVGYLPEGVAKSHRVVLASGDSDTVRYDGTPLSCDTGDRLAPGTYTLYAKVRLTIGGVDEIVAGPGNSVVLH